MRWNRVLGGTCAVVALGVGPQSATLAADATKPAAGANVTGAAGCELAKLVPEDVSAGDHFGMRVSLSGSVAVVAAARQACWTNAPFCGAIYVFRGDASGWQLDRKITAADGASGDFFGVAVGISDDTIVVGALNHGGAGAAYVYRSIPDSWVQAAKLTAPDAVAGQDFGESVSISGDLIAIGGRGGSQGDPPGAVYVFRREKSQWVFEAKLQPDDPTSDQGFGAEVSIHDAQQVAQDVLIVGAFSDDERGFDAGAAYVFRRSAMSWTQEAKLTASDAEAGDTFGAGVTVVGALAVVRGQRGDVYAFRSDGMSWTEEAKLEPSDEQLGEAFGSSVAAEADLIVVGDRRNRANDDDGANDGAAYIFRRVGSEWVEATKLIASDEVDEFGGAVSVDQGRVLLGAGRSNQVGSAYVFSAAAGEDCNANLVKDGCDLAAGLSEDCNGNEVPDECDIAGGLSEDCSLDGIPDECDPDCNANGAADSCDLFSGTSEDCNVNFVPDECDLPFTCVELEGCEVQSLTGPAAFGSSTAIDGVWAVLAAGGDDRDNGRAFAYHREGNTWLFGGELTPAAPANTYFYGSGGSAAAINGNRALIGGLDAAYVFRRDGSDWSEEATLLPSAPPSAGRAMAGAIRGDLAVVGADEHWDDSATGKAWVFRRNGTTWQEEATLTPGDAAPGDELGRSVATDGERALVGAPSSDTEEIRSGSAYVFRQSGSIWVEEAKLTPPDPVVNGKFGWSVALTEDYAVIGAPSAHIGSAPAGAAYVFRRLGTNWVLEATLTPAAGSPGDDFGSSVSISDRRILVGAYEAEAAYVYELDPTGTYWIEKQKLVPSDEGARFFGYSAGVHGDWVVVGALGRERSYFFSIGGDCNENGVADACDILSGTSLDSTGDGVPDECGDCNANGIDDEIDLATGTSEDCNGNDRPDECDPDCNENGVPDECDILQGTTNDCDRNGIPDDCEPDCNDNGITDACDIASGLVLDENANGVPDQCECDQPYLALVPVGSDGPSTILNNEIIMDSGGQVITLEVRVGCWDPLELGIELYGYGVRVDDSSYTTGLRGELSIFVPPCESDQDCHATNGPASVCDNLCSECGDICSQCSVDTERPDYVFAGLNSLTGCDVLAADFRVGASLFFGNGARQPCPFPQDGLYGATAVLFTSPDAAGTFTVSFDLASMLGPDGLEISPVVAVPAKITVTPGRCCFQAASGGQCLDNVSVDECNAQAGPVEFTPDASCGNGNGCGDCNANGVFDHTDIEQGDSGDCNGNGRPDECEVPPIDADAPDCNGNGVPDECDADCDGNDVPDDCDAALECLYLDAPTIETSTGSSSRYLVFNAENTGCNAALRVTCVEAPEGFEHLFGQRFWADQPELYCENSIQVRPPTGGCGAAPGLPSLTYWGATLRCEPVYADYGSLGVIHLFHESLIPGATYTVEAVHQACDAGEDSSFSRTLTVRTAIWGDVAGAFDSATGQWSGPDGSVDVPTDMLAVIDKFINKSGAPSTARTDIAPALPDGRIDMIPDLVYVIDAFRGSPYPFDAPQPCP